MVTKQQQLEWLAKELSEWPDEYNEKVFASSCEVGMRIVFPSHYAEGHAITRQEWQQERYKMQKQADKLKYNVMTLDEAIAHADEKSRELKGTCATNHSRLAYWLTEYRDIINNMANQQQPSQSAQPAQDNSWHERGELPPVGCECVWVDESGVDGPAGSLYPCVGDTVSVCAHRQTPGGNVIAIFTWAPGGDGLRVAASRMPEDFRPLRTEREKAIDALIEIICAGWHFTRRDSAACEIAERIYDAGYRKAST